MLGIGSLGARQQIYSELRLQRHRRQGRLHSREYVLPSRYEGEAANRFQEWIANIVISSIRRNGYYATPKAGNPDFPPELSVHWVEVKPGKALVAAAKLTSDRKFREAIIREAVHILDGKGLTPALTISDDDALER